MADGVIQFADRTGGFTPQVAVNTYIYVGDTLGNILMGLSAPQTATVQGTVTNIRGKGQVQQGQPICSIQQDSAAVLQV